MNTLLKYIIIILIISIFSSTYVNLLEGPSYAKSDKILFFKKTINKLIKNGADSAIIYNIIKDERVRFDKKYVRINTTSFLKKSDYSINYNQFSVLKVRKFINDHTEILKRCSEEYDIPQEVIASILWIETKNGSYLGNHHVLSVYLSATMSEEPEFINENFELFRKSSEFEGKDSTFIMDFVRARAAKKANWAINELLAIEKIYKNSSIDIFELYGSWAGAFGYSQFLPSSYLNYSVDGNKDGTINLFSLEDAIYSIANYLKKNGWNDSYDSQNKAVFAYNNSTEYVQAVLTLFKKVSSGDSASFLIIPELISPVDSL